MVPAPVERSELPGHRRRSQIPQHRQWLRVYAVLSLSDFRLARSRSLSVGARLPTPRRIRPERAATAPPIPIWLAAAPARWPSYGVRLRHQGDRNSTALGSTPCFLSRISGWRDRGLYPLARGCRRRAGSGPSVRPRRRQFLFGWRQRRRGGRAMGLGFATRAIATARH